MCAALTENVILTRTRSHDLKSVRKLNCWGCTLKDVSIVSRMPALEVISLSINSIDTLEYFASCRNLQELYLRKNEIKNINEILHLAQLQFLKKLSLEDNPCNKVDNYRLTVLKALPNLEFLDNVQVTPEEIYQAEKLGRDLSWPGGGEEELLEEEAATAVVQARHEDEEVEMLTTNEVNPVEYGNNTGSMPRRHDSHQSLASQSNVAGNENGRYNGTHDYQHNANDIETMSSASAGPYHHHHHHHASSTNLASANSPASRSTAYANGHGRAQHNGTNASNGGTNMAKSNSLSDYNIYNNNNYRGTPSSPPPSSNYEQGNNDYNTSYTESEVGHYPGATANGGQFNGHNGGPNSHHAHHGHHSHAQHSSLSGSNRTIQSSSSSAASQSARLLPKGGKNRNANILSAVLCLIKELDYGSLEVVDTTIHCRMEEMED